MEKRHAPFRPGVPQPRLPASANSVSLAERAADGQPGAGRWATRPSGQSHRHRHAQRDGRAHRLWHGLLSLTLLRAATRLAGPALPPLAGSSRAQRACAHAAHLAIYGFILGSCLLGWIIVNAKGLRIPVPLLGIYFPRLVEADPALVVSAVRLHEWLGWIFYGLLAVHVSAAIWHHAVLKDDTLRRMSWRRPASVPTLPWPVATAVRRIPKRRIKSCRPRIGWPPKACSKSRERDPALGENRPISQAVQERGMAQSP